ncbi:hypothetical protein [Pedobacter suwonensis]|uniref:hypothetical protein n=1 Tax=Pedobacter suwonensis TaxID=332999 RepID=UPI0011AAD49F|nr:hypothetical protein [Pedobacter suwonensis]
MAQTPPITDAYIDEIIKAPDAYNPTLNKTQGVKLRELIKLMRDKMDQSSGGGGNLLTSVTYSQLVNLVLTDSLVPGAQYLLTDYKMYWKPFVQDSGLRASDNVEPLILYAVAVNKISSSAKSTIYPNDVIYYTIGRFNYDGNVIPYDENEPTDTSYKGVVPVKGMIYRRIDENRKLDINFDYKGFWVEKGDYNLPIESQLKDNVSIIQNGLDSEYSQYPIIIPFATLKNTKITIGFNAAYAGNADQLCPTVFEDLKLEAYNSEIDFLFIQDDYEDHLKPRLVVKDSKLTKLFWISSTPPNWNKVLNFNYKAINYQPYPRQSHYIYQQDGLSILANNNIKLNVTYDWDYSEYLVVEVKNAHENVFLLPSGENLVQNDLTGLLSLVLKARI